MSCYTINGVRVSFPYKPYPSQMAMMNKIIIALQKGQNSLLESPTGSGKSLALLCASLAWQESEEIKIKDYNKVLEDGLIDGDVVIDEEDVNNFEASNGFIINDDNGNNDSSSPPSKRLRQSVKVKKRVPRIFFGTRTHKQIAQIIRELKKTRYKNVRMTILGSREHSCIHPTVSKMSKKTEGCKELLDRRNTHTGCIYQSNVKSKTGSHAALDAIRRTKEAWDLEDLISAGKRVRSCPYFTTRQLMPSSRIVFCPYNYLIEPMIRKSLDINLTGNIMILDEAHNIEDSARSASSFQITQDELRDAMKDLESLASYGILKETHTALAKVCSDLSNWIDSSSKEQQLTDYSDFNSSSKVWTGTQILAIFNLKGLGEGPFRILCKHLNDALNQQSTALSAEARESNEPLLKTSTLDLLEGFFLIIDNLYKEGMKYRDDYRIALTKTQKKKSSNTLGITYTLNFWCLNPALSFLSWKNDIRSIVLTSGTLSPMTSFASELNLDFPIRLEASHVIDERQVWISTISHGPTGRGLHGTFKNTETFDFQDELGRLIHQVCYTVRHGILLFLPSYRMLSKLGDRWRSTGLWKDIQRRKIIMEEPRFSDQFESSIRHFYDVIDQTSTDESNTDDKVDGALFIAVCRGKVSEGLDFADNKARAVICVGIPFPNARDVQVDLKKKYNDVKKGMDDRVLSGNEWYEIQAFRALNQALGRCIRHRNDWGSILMVDERYSKIERYIGGLSKWVRTRVVHFNRFETMVRNLSVFNQRMNALAEESSEEVIKKEPLETTNNDGIKKMEPLKTRGVDGIEKVEPLETTDDDGIKKVEPLKTKHVDGNKEMEPLQTKDDDDNKEMEPLKTTDNDYQETKSQNEIESKSSKNADVERTRFHFPPVDSTALMKIKTTNPIRTKKPPVIQYVDDNSDDDFA